MGLDMYLSAKKHISKIDWAKLQKDDSLQMTSPEVVNPSFKHIIELTSMEDYAIDVYGITVETVCAYWRKANSIHKWFVDNVQNGEDNCGEYYVSTEQLKELRDLCVKALEELDGSLLPPQSGFFFGNTEINEWYWADIESTIHQLNRVLSLDSELVSYSYHSSW